MFSKRNPSRVHTGKHRSHNKNGGQARPPSNRALRLIFGSQNTIVSHHVTPRYLSSRQCRFRMFSADKKSRSICSFPHVTAPDTQHGLQALRLYYNQTQSSQDPKRGISCTKVVLIRRGISSTKVALQPSAIQPGSHTRHFQCVPCTSQEIELKKHDPDNQTNIKTTAM